jgi:predicted N-acyltransferase
MCAALFTSNDYLDPLERHGSVGASSGWTPLALNLAGELRAPTYLKTHSWGEFVFDFQIAQAYAQRGLAYYPKLVCCVPYTPVPGPRLLAADDPGRAVVAEGLVDGARRHGASGVHVLYPHAADAEVLDALAWLRREQLRYVWHNRDYADFDAFTAALSSKRRKNIRRERRLVAEQGLEIGWQRGDAFSDGEWTRVYALYARTYHQRGQTPYLALGCLQDWARAFGARMQFCTARRKGEIVAIAFFFVDGDQLCGRHWGSAADDELLHFELCYYQGIDYAIRHRLEVFDAGVQGEHKLLRGFDPLTVPSFHWYAHVGFSRAIAAFYAEEREQVAAHCRALAAHSAYRETD